MTKKILTKVLCIVLVCVMLATCMGAYSGETLANTKDEEFSVVQNADGLFVHENEMGIFKRILFTNKVMLSESEDFKDIYIDNSNKYYLEVQENTFKQVEKLSYDLRASDTLTRLNSTNLPEEIVSDIAETMIWIEEDNKSTNPELVLFANAPGLIATTYTSRNGIDIRVYEVRFIGMSTNWVIVAEGASVTEATNHS